MNDIRAATAPATANNMEQVDLFRPEVSPGYAAWPVLWRGPGETIYLAFLEKRRAPNPTWKEIPLEFLEAMSLPINYHTTFCNGAQNIVGESVVMRSDDEGRTWSEVGRCISRVMNLFAWACLDDGSLIRAVSNDYVAFDLGTKPRLWVEVSHDQGNTWQTRSVLMEEFQTYTYRLRRLRDGTLVLAAPYHEGFGPGRPRMTRGVKRADVMQELTCAIFTSPDQGHTWLGPTPVFAGVASWEPDFVELPNGDLLLLNSTVQHGKAARQFVFRQNERFIPGPVLAVTCGDVPETVTRTDAGLLVGAIRHGNYTCSNDLGETWHRIEGMPTCGYEPYILSLRDDSHLCVWHHGADNFFGEVGQYIGSHRFDLEIQLPAITRLVLRRVLADSDERYTNVYTVTLTTDNKPRPGETIHFAYHLRYTDEYDRTDDPREAGVVVEAHTDANGCAMLDLRPILDKVDDPHQSYRVTAWYEPGGTETGLAATRSDIYSAYALTTTREELAAGFNARPNENTLYFFVKHQSQDEVMPCVKHIFNRL